MAVPVISPSSTLKMTTKMEIQHVPWAPYRPQLTDLIGGQTQAPLPAPRR